MIFKGLVIQTSDASYSGKSGRVERFQITCLDASPVKLKNTVDVVIPQSEVAKLPQGDLTMKEVTFDVLDIEVFNGRVRMPAHVAVVPAVAMK